MRMRTSGIVVIVSLGCSLWAASGRVLAGGAHSQAAAQGVTVQDDHQRSALIYSFKITAKSGPQRGEEIYYYKCWFCHNQYAKSGPPLKDLYKRSGLMLTKEAVNDQTVAEKIRAGGPAMPGYRYTLNDADIADLLAYIKDAKCCFDAEEPPPNPRYRGR